MLYSLFLALTFTTTVLPLTINSTLLENTKTGKRVLLLGDAHDCHTETILKELGRTQRQQAQSALVTFDTLKNQQKKDLTSFAHEMLADNNKQSDQTIVISEIGIGMFKKLYKAALGSVETMYVLPHIFVHYNAQAASTEEGKRALIEQSMNSFGCHKIKSAFQSRNGIRVIAGDTFRNNTQGFLLFNASFKTTQDIIAFKETLSTGQAKFNLSDLKKDVCRWQNIFTKACYKEQTTAQLLTFVDNGIKTGKISETTPLIDGIITLCQNNELKKSFDELVVKFLSNKCNLELLLHVGSFENDDSLNYLILNAGAAHSAFIENWLTQHGYHIVEQSGNRALGKKLKTASREQGIDILSQAFSDLEQQSPLAILPKLFAA